MSLLRSCGFARSLSEGLGKISESCNRLRVIDWRGKGANRSRLEGRGMDVCALRRQDSISLTQQARGELHALSRRADSSAITRPPPAPRRITPPLSPQVSTRLDVQSEKEREHSHGHGLEAREGREERPCEENSLRRRRKNSGGGVGEGCGRGAGEVNQGWQSRTRSGEGGRKEGWGTHGDAEVDEDVLLRADGADGSPGHKPLVVRKPNLFRHVEPASHLAL